MAGLNGIKRTSTIAYDTQLMFIPLGGGIRCGVGDRTSHGIRQRRAVIEVMIWAC